VTNVRLPATSAAGRCGETMMRLPLLDMVIVWCSDYNKQQWNWNYCRSIDVKISKGRGIGSRPH